ncbi:MAG TPA: acyltransferase [Rhodocyclaceae bacterium]|nr:acyltransferase [Rhodocyclaceae bacterium]
MNFVRDEQFFKNNFDLVRLIAAVLVVYGHAYAIMPPQQHDDLIKSIGFAPAHRVGLYMFFLVSGFLVTRAIERRPDYIFFIKSRLLRIVPGLFVSAIFALLIVAPFSAWEINNISHWRDSILFVVANTTMFFPIAGVDGFEIFQSNNLPKVINGSLWSIALEARIYFFLLLLHVSRALSSSMVLKLSTYVVVGAVLFLNPTYLQINPDSIHLTCAMYFFVGSLSYQFRKYIPTSLIFPVIFLLLCVISGFGDYFPVEMRRFFVHVSIFFIVFSIAFGSRPIVLPGDYSYGIYLYAFPIQQVVASEYPKISPDQAFGLAMLFILPAGVLSWHFVEFNMMKLKDKNLSDPLLFAFILFIVINFFIAMYLLKSDISIAIALLILAIILGKVVALVNHKGRISRSAS